nr:uncharacterized protein CTRU02_09286 [Colletotrichum truncatum]KAF6788965.1 hypothetical protein CTRU02_09286 [Colletotrichum truncatum]
MHNILAYLLFEASSRFRHLSHQGIPRSNKRTSSP